MREMKESNISWVGKIPCNWKIEKNKHCFQLEKNIVGENKDKFELLSLTKKGIIKKDESGTGGKVPESFETYQSVKKGQLVMCLFDLDVSAVFSGLSNYDGMISPAYKVYNCNKIIDKNYAKYWFECCFDGRKYKAYSKSLRYVVNTEDFGTIEILLPPKEEQEKIAEFLDKKITEIDNVIEKTKETIEDYKRFKISIITEAVTKGLDKHAETKDTGINWIDRIPKKWNVQRIKDVASLKTGTTPSTQNQEWFDGDYNWFTPGDFNENYIMEKSIRKLSIQAKLDNVATIIPKDTTLIIGIGGTAGKIGFVERECSCNQQITAIISNKVVNKYIMYWMIANTKFLKETAMYTTLPIINNETLGRYLFINPNSTNEERLIVDYLDKKCSDIDKLLLNKQSIIEKLEQYKISLIYEYVTGKKEVV